MAQSKTKTSGTNLSVGDKQLVILSKKKKKNSTFLSQTSSKKGTIAGNTHSTENSAMDGDSNALTSICNNGITSFLTSTSYVHPLDLVSLPVTADAILSNKTHQSTTTVKQQSAQQIKKLHKVRFTLSVPTQSLFVINDIFDIAARTANIHIRTLLFVSQSIIVSSRPPQINNSSQRFVSDSYV